MLLVIDTNGNIETLPIFSLYNYLKSIETYINSLKTETTETLSTMQTNIDTGIRISKLDNKTINRHIIELQSQITEFKLPNIFQSLNGGFLEE